MHLSIHITSSCSAAAPRAPRPWINRCPPRGAGGCSMWLGSGSCDLHGTSPRRESADGALRLDAHFHHCTPVGRSAQQPPLLQPDVSIRTAVAPARWSQERDVLRSRAGDDNRESLRVAGVDAASSRTRAAARSPCGPLEATAVHAPVDTAKEAARPKLWPSGNPNLRSSVAHRLSS